MARSLFVHPVHGEFNLLFSQMEMEMQIPLQVDVPYLHVLYKPPHLTHLTSPRSSVPSDGRGRTNLESSQVESGGGWDWAWDLVNSDELNGNGKMSPLPYYPTLPLFPP